MDYIDLGGSACWAGSNGGQLTLGQMGLGPDGLIWGQIYPLPIVITLISFACRGGVEVAGWTLDLEVRVWFPAYPHCMWAFWWQGDKERLRTSWCPFRLGMLKNPSCPWRWVPGSRSKFGNRTSVLSLYRWNIAECGFKPQSTNQPTN